MPAITTYPFSSASLEALHIASQLAKENMHPSYGAAHLLKALLHKEFPLLKFLERKGVDVYYLEEWAETRMEQYPRAAKPSAEPQPDDACEAAFKEAAHLQTKLLYSSIEPECLLAALSTPGVSFSHEQLKTYPLLPASILQWYIPAGNENGHDENNNPRHFAAAKETSEALSKYCVNKLAEAGSGKWPPVIGRDKELRQICEIISRRSKSNVIITGDSGVGKTALLNGFAMAAAEQLLPEHLQNITLYELDNSALFAGASYKGEAEDRMHKIVKSLALLDTPVLFIDEIHTLLDKHNPHTGIAGILKNELSKGVLTVVCTTTHDEYRKSIEKEETFSRMFEVIRLEEPSAEMAEKMLRNQAVFYQQHHRLSIREDVFPEAVRLAKRYIKDRKLPDAAIGLLDRTLAVCRMMSNTSARDMEKLSAKLNEIKDRATEEQLRWFYHEMQAGLSPALLARLDENTDIAAMSSVEEMKNCLERMLAKLSEIAAAPKESIDPADLNAVVANITGIPLGKIQAKEQQRLVNMENDLRRRVIGQDHALKTVADAILESRAGLNKGGQPIASFFFLGPTGTGKTELAKSLAEFLFQDEHAIIRFDMSEFKEAHAAALLYGAPPGYVGYEEGGMLVNKIRKQPYAIVLFDEIEKAHPSVFDIFLQILDEGRMHDRLGKEGDFTNAIILFTSNIGAENIMASFGKGVIPRQEDLLETMTGYFRPEFLARITEIVPFAPVSKENMMAIFNIHLQPLVQQLQQQGIAYKVSPEAAEHLAQLGFSPRYGVRPLKGVIRTVLRKPLSRMIVNNEIKKGATVQTLLNENKELSWVINP